MDTIHTKIASPLELRKLLLESALDTTELLKTTDRAIALREEHKLFKKQLDSNLKQLKLQMKDLVKKLPPLPEEFTEVEKENKVKGMPKVTKQDLISSRQRLSDDLNEIRRRIATLRRNV